MDNYVLWEPAASIFYQNSGTYLYTKNK